MHKLCAHCNEAGTDIQPKVLIVEACMAHNVILTLEGVTPCTVLGRNPLDFYETDNVTLDAVGGPGQVTTAAEEATKSWMIGKAVALPMIAE